jgi:hypothetical protein
MNEIKLAAEFANDAARDLQDVREAAQRGEGALRVLRDVEMGWVGGGDGLPDWGH